MIKKSLVFLIIAATSFVASAEFRWGPTAGTNISKLHFSQDLIEVKTLAGASAGVLGELMIPGIGFGVDFGLNWAMTGSTINFGQREVWASDGYGNERCYFHTLEIPVNLRFKYTNLEGIERYVAPFVYGGPLFSINVAHNKIDALKYSGGSVMAQCGIGVELLRHIQISGGYYWGLTYQLKTKKLDNFSAKPQGWLIKAAYLF